MHFIDLNAFIFVDLYSLLQLLVLPHLFHCIYIYRAAYFTNDFHHKLTVPLTLFVGKIIFQFFDFGFGRSFGSLSFGWMGLENKER